MASKILWFLRHAMAPTCLSVMLIACGGGGADSSAEAEDQASSSPADADMQAALAETAAYRPHARAMAVLDTTVVPVLTVRAKGSLANAVAPIMQVRVDGILVGTSQVTNTDDWTDYTYSAAGLKVGSKVEVVYTNDLYVSETEDRNLYIGYISSGATVVLPTMTGAVIDRGSGAAAFDAKNTIAGRGEIYENGALRLKWPTTTVLSAAQRARQQDASRFLMQATFGPTSATIKQLMTQTFSSWIDAQRALPVTPVYVPAVQARYNLGDVYRPGGKNYSPYVVSTAFWKSALTQPDQLRRRVAYALHQIFMVSQADSNLWAHSRAYAQYQDLLHRNALGNFRTLLEDVALSPATGIYLSHLRNRKEDPITGRLPDENFAREIMQLYTIGLYELNPDGTYQTDGNGEFIETYNNADVMALAKVFTSLSWGFPDNELTESKFLWEVPDLRKAYDRRIDVLPMKAYPGQHSTGSKVIFSGKPWAVTLPAGNAAMVDIKKALDVLYNHPNVPPFISRQLIQKLVTSNPSPAYVGRVSAVFANNGKGVRGDIGAVVKAILLDAEARAVPTGEFGKVREPVLRVAQWMRAFNATSTNGTYDIVWDSMSAGQILFNAPSVFGDFRPGYIPPNSSFAERGATAPEFQIINENTVAGWANVAQAMAGGGLGWYNNAREVVPNHSSLLSRLNSGDTTGMLDELDMLLMGSHMSNELRQAILDGITEVGYYGVASQKNRVNMAVFLALASPEYLVQR